MHRAARPWASWASRVRLRRTAALVRAAVGGHLFLGSAQHRRETVDAIVSVLPLSSSGATNVRRLVLTATSSSGAFSALSAIGLVWASTGMMAALRIFINRAWRIKAPRPFLRGKLWDVLLVASFGLVFLALSAAVVVTDFGSYNRVYGSLAAPVALLFFVYLSAIVVLWCAHLAAHLDQASARLRDTPTRRSSASARSRTRPSRMSRHGLAEISRRRW
jgi:uncharacterized BrkB/YihY/UPF0761 family membrane protein